MRFDRPLCPACSRPTCSVLTQLCARLEIAPLPDGAFERTGQTLLWATERPQMAEGFHLLRCKCGQIWTARRLDEEPAADRFPGALPPFTPDSAPCNPPPCVGVCVETPSEPEILRVRLRCHAKTWRRATRSGKRPIPADPTPCCPGACLPS